MKKAIVIIVAVAILGTLSYSTRQSQPTPSLNTKGSSQVSSANSSVSSSSAAASYKDGTYTGNSEDNPYGTVQVAAVISGGKITDIKFLQMPLEEGHSKEVTQFSEPLLKQAAINRQTASGIDFVSGATDTSIGFKSSLQSALDQAVIASGNSTST